MLTSEQRLEPEWLSGTANNLQSGETKKQNLSTQSTSRDKPLEEEKTQGRMVREFTHWNLKHNMNMTLMIPF